MRIVSDVAKLIMVALLFFIVIAGCSSLGRVQTQEIKLQMPPELPSGKGWWFARFRMHWPPDTQPVWYMDLYLAHQVLLPKLGRHRSEIDLWRFHRRAARDGAGRQFSFIFYSSPSIAQQIYNEIKSDPLVANLKSAGVIDNIVFDDPSRITRPNITDAGDENWPDAIQKTWPFYIMGASQMWLNLIAELAVEKLPDKSLTKIADIESFYQRVDESLTALWQKNGRHAFLHHLNALFEYEPLIYLERRYMTF